MHKKWGYTETDHEGWSKPPMDRFLAPVAAPITPSGPLRIPHALPCTAHHRLVLREGFEPPLPCGKRILSSSKAMTSRDA